MYPLHPPPCVRPWLEGKKFESIGKTFANILTEPCGSLGDHVFMPLLWKRHFLLLWFCKKDNEVILYDSTRPVDIYLVSSITRSSKRFWKMSIVQRLVLQTLETIACSVLSYRLFNALYLDQAVAKWYIDMPMILWKASYTVWLATLK